MKIGVLKETVSGESRVAATPETVKKMIALNHSVSIEAGAGIQASISDEDYKNNGAEIVSRDQVTPIRLVVNGQAFKLKRR